jgi:hypothetical protein
MKSLAVEFFKECVGALTRRLVRRGGEYDQWTFEEVSRPNLSGSGTSAHGCRPFELHGLPINTLTLRLAGCSDGPLSARSCSLKVGRSPFVRSPDMVVPRSCSFAASARLRQVAYSLVSALLDAHQQRRGGRLRVQAHARKHFGQPQDRRSPPPVPARR